ncbi:unnamed protein product [Victoria cruziana]
MHGRRSLKQPQLPLVPELQKKCRQQKAKTKVISESEMGDTRPPAGQQQLPVEQQQPQQGVPAPRLLREFFIPSEYDRGSGSVGPLVGPNQYEIKAATINMLPSFHRLASEDPYRHLDLFLDVCATVKISNVEEGALRLRLFPFSLRDRARDWLKSLPPSVSINTWEDLQREFLKKYFPIGKTNHYRRAISLFTASEGESFHQAWERMKDLLIKCPHHQIPRWQVLQGFYDGLTEAHRQVIDSSCGGSLMMKSEDDAWLLYDTLAENSLHNTGPTLLRHQPTTSGASKKGVSEIGSVAHMDQKLDTLSRKLDQLLSTRTTGYGQPVCTLCDGMGHTVEDCPMARSDISEQAVNAAQGFSRSYDPYSVTYNPGWRNHPNFSWRNTGYQQSQQQFTPQRQQIEYPQRQMIEYPQTQRQIVQYPQDQRQMVPVQQSSTEDRLVRLYEDIKASNEKAHARYDRELGAHSDILATHSQMLQRMEQQMGKMADILSQRRVEGSLPSQPLNNPKGKGPVLMIEGPSSSEPYDVAALRSGREYQSQHQHQPPQPPMPDQTTTTTTAATPLRGSSTDPYASSASG